MLNINYSISEEILKLPATKLANHMESLSLFHLAGKEEKPLFISVLQHGHEVSGWDAVRHFLLENKRLLPRSIILLVANVEAAQQGLRSLPEQPDFNRSWPGSYTPKTIIHEKLAAITNWAKTTQPFASIDFHNNSGKNPFYAAINQHDYRLYYLASLFNSIAVYFDYPVGVQAMSFLKFCPAITVECGIINNSVGATFGNDYIKKLMQLTTIPNEPIEAEKLKIFAMIASVSLSPAVNFSFKKNNNADINFRSDLDDLNFSEIPKGTVLANSIHTKNGLIIKDAMGNILENDYLAIEEGKLICNKSIIPSMLSTNENVVRNDCLGYFMKEVPLIAAN